MNPLGPPKGIRHVFRVGTPMSDRITTNMATTMNATDPSTVATPIRTRRFSITQMPIGTSTNDTSSFTLSAATTATAYQPHRRSNAAHNANGMNNPRYESG